MVDGETRYRAAEDQLSDDSGRFRFDAVATNVPLMLEIRRQSDGPVVEFYRPRLFQPSEIRNDIQVAIGSTDSGAESSKVPVRPLADRIANVIRDARLADMHALIVLQGNSSKEVARLAEEVVDPAGLPEIYGFLPIVVRSTLTESDLTTLEQLGWQRPDPGEVLLIAVDGGGKQIGSQRLAAANHDAAAKLFAAFIKQCVPLVRDAQAKLASAQDQAKRTGRRVWIVEGGVRCGPCFRLARWMDEQQALLKKDYVIVKILNGRDDHADEVMKVLNQPPQSGIPWMAITEPDGAVLVTSDSPLGNLGFPTSPEDIRYLREMLDRTAQRLTPEERDLIAQSLVKPAR